MFRLQLALIKDEEVIYSQNAYTLLQHPILHRSSCMTAKFVKIYFGYTFQSILFTGSFLCLKGGRELIGDFDILFSILCSFRLKYYVINLSNIAKLDILPYTYLISLPFSEIKSDLQYTGIPNLSMDVIIMSVIHQNPQTQSSYST